MFKNLAEMEQFIGRMIDKLDSCRTDCFELETGDVKIKLDRHGDHSVCAFTPAQMQIQETAASTVLAEPVSEAVPVAPASSVLTLNAPLLGVAYAAPSPDAEPFVTVGKQVKKGDIICIIEAMKVMNEIEADHDGVIAEIMFENGKMVEFGQPLVSLK